MGGERLPYEIDEGARLAHPSFYIGVQHPRAVTSLVKLCRTVFKVLIYTTICQCMTCLPTLSPELVAELYASGKELNMSFIVLELCESLMPFSPE